MNFFVLVCLTVLHTTLVTSVPLGPPGSEDPGKDFAVPHHTTNSFIVRHLKNLYNYVFNKPDSEHADGYTKVYVMGKHMYYTYTHEFTPSNNQSTDADGHVITDDPIARQYLKNEDLLKYREELKQNVENKKRNEEKSRRKLWEYAQGKPIAKEEAPKETPRAAPREAPKEGPREPTGESHSATTESLVKSILKQIPVLKRFVRSVHGKPPKDESSNEYEKYANEPPYKMIPYVIRDKFKRVAKKVLGRSTSKISDNIWNELKIWGGKMGEKFLNLIGLKPVEQ